MYVGKEAVMVVLQTKKSEREILLNTEVLLKISLHGKKNTMFEILM